MNYADSGDYLCVYQYQTVIRVVIKIEMFLLICETAETSK